MKKLVLSIACVVALAVSIQAQQLHLGQAQPSSQSLVAPSGVTAVVIDTIMPKSVMAGGCALSGTSAGLYYYSINRGTARDSGFYFGTGKFPQAGVTVTALGQRFTLGASNATLTNIIVRAAKGKGGTTTTTASVYSLNASKAPNAVLGTSTPLPMSAYTTTGYTNFAFSTPVALTANTSYFATITVPAFGGADKDTLAILDTKAGCNSNDSLAYVQANNIAWTPVTRIFGSTQNMDLMIFPVVDIATGINNYVSNGGLTLFAASPNPANQLVDLNFSLNKNSAVEIELFDMTGKLVQAVKQSDLFSAGKNTIRLDVSALEAGTYMYSIHGAGNTLFSKIVVIK
jgi:hypothetical protein